MPKQSPQKGDPVDEGTKPGCICSNICCDLISCNSRRMFQGSAIENAKNDEIATECRVQGPKKAKGLNRRWQKTSARKEKSSHCRGGKRSGRTSRRKHTVYEISGGWEIYQALWHQQGRRTLHYRGHTHDVLLHFNIILCSVTSWIKFCYMSRATTQLCRWKWQTQSAHKSTIMGQFRESSSQCSSKVALFMTNIPHQSAC